MTEKTQEQRLLTPQAAARGEVNIPGSKSMTNRCFLLAALAQGRTVLHGALDADDTNYMANALAELGVALTKLDHTTWQIDGCGGNFPNKNAHLFLGNAGTAVRTLTAALALVEGEYQIAGVERMHQRPIADLVVALQSLGAKVDYLGESGFPPLALGSFEPDAKQSSRVSVRGDVSSQFLTGLLLSAPLLGREVTIEIDGELISKPYVAITLSLMADFGVRVQCDGWSSFTVPAGSSYQAMERCVIEADASSASYFLAAGALGGGPVVVNGLNEQALQGDVKFAQALSQVGADVSYQANSITVSAPASGRLKAFDLDLNHIPDAAMGLAVVALRCDGPCTLRNIGSWRVKETDRIAAMATELQKLGVSVEQGEDWLSITPPEALREGVAIDTYDDHRIAMCFSLVSLLGVSVVINDPRCVEKTFPDYFDRFSSIASAARVRGEV